MELGEACGNMGGEGYAHRPTPQHPPPPATATATATTTTTTTTHNRWSEGAGGSGGKGSRAVGTVAAARSSHPCPPQRALASTHRLQRRLRVLRVLQLGALGGGILPHALHLVGGWQVVLPLELCADMFQQARNQRLGPHLVLRRLPRNRCRRFVRGAGGGKGCQDRDHHKIHGREWRWGARGAALPHL